MLYLFDKVLVVQSGFVLTLGAGNWRFSFVLNKVEYSYNSCELTEYLKVDFLVFGVLVRSLLFKKSFGVLSGVLRYPIVLRSCFPREVSSFTCCLFKDGLCKN